MKKIIVLLLALFALSMVTQAQAKLEKNAAGKYRIVTINANWKETGITVDSAALPYVKFFSSAVATPGKPIMVYQDEKIIKLKPIFKKLVEVEKGEIVYDQATKKISLVVSHPKETKPSYLILFAIIGVLSMIVANIMWLFKKKGIVFIAIATFAAVFAATAAFSVNAFGTTFIAIFAIILAIMVFVTENEKKNKKKKNNSIIFYALMALYFVLIFI